MNELNNKEYGRLIIIGASGHGKVVSDIARLIGYSDIIFLDDDQNIKECGGYLVVGDSSHAPQGEIFIAVGNAMIRKTLMERYSNRVQPVLIHPNAVIAKDVQLGIGTVVMAGAVINPGAVIGKGVIINTCSSVDHDCMISDYVHIAVGSHLSGTVNVGEGTWIGTGATVCNNINICRGCMIGAGAVVIKNIEEEGTYVGVPARKRGVNE